MEWNMEKRQNAIYKGNKDRKIKREQLEQERNGREKSGLKKKRKFIHCGREEKKFESRERQLNLNKNDRKDIINIQETGVGNKYKRLEFVPLCNQTGRSYLEGWNEIGCRVRRRCLVDNYRLLATGVLFSHKPKLSLIITFFLLEFLSFSLFFRLSSYLSNSFVFTLLAFFLFF